MIGTFVLRNQYNWSDRDSFFEGFKSICNLAVMQAPSSEQESFEQVTPGCNGHEV